MGLRRDHHRFSKRVTRTKRWKVLRMQILERDSFRCCSCGCGGRLEVDHIKPVRTHPELSYAPGNLQALCPRCHTRKTRIECGHRPPDPARLGWAAAVGDLEKRKRRWSIPPDLHPARVPATIVCGPPAAGKTTYVKHHACDGDTVIDFDDCLRSVGGIPWDTDRSKVRAAFSLRNAALHALATDASRPAWFIVGAPDANERAAWLRALGPRARCVVLDTEPAVCKARIAADPSRRHASEKMCTAVDRWWSINAATGGKSPIEQKG